MSQTTVIVISLIAIVNLGLMAIFSWLRTSKQPAYFWFGWTFFSAALAISNNISIYSGNGNIWLYHLGLISNIAWGGYIIQFVNDLRKESKKITFKPIYFLPAYAYLIFVIYCVFEPEVCTETIDLAAKGRMNIFSLIFNLVIVLYSFTSNIVLLSREYIDKYRIENEPKKKLKERKEILWILLVLQFCAFCPFILSLDLEFVILYMPIFGQIYFIYVFYKLSNSTLLKFHQSDEIKNYQPTTNIKYSGLNIDNNKSEEIFSNIESFIHKEMCYLKPDCTLTYLSQQLRYSANIISMVINTQSRSSFPDYINSLRVKKAEELLLTSKNKHLTIEAIGLECGFNNRTSFYNAFKKHTGKLPTEYIKTTKDA